MRIKALVFDLDGTLYRQSPVRRAMAWQLARRYWPRPAAGWRTARALQAYRQAQERLRAAGGVGGPARQLDEACRLSGQPAPVVRDAVDAWMEQAPLSVLPRHVRSGVRELLGRARAHGIRIGLLSDYPAAAKLQAMQLSEFFDAVVTAQDPDVQCFKPDPRGLQVTLARLAVRPEDALYVGDRPDVDGETAKRAGVRCAIIAAPRRHAADDGWQTMQRLDDLLPLLER